jgi:hypothetical protein
MGFSMKVTLENGLTVESSGDSPQDAIGLFDEAMARVKSLKSL